MFHHTNVVGFRDTGKVHSPNRQRGVSSFQLLQVMLGSGMGCFIYKIKRLNYYRSSSSFLHFSGGTDWDQQHLLCSATVVCVRTIRLREDEWSESLPTLTPPSNTCPS